MTQVILLVVMWNLQKNAGSSVLAGSNLKKLNYATTFEPKYLSMYMQMVVLPTSVSTFRTKAIGTNPFFTLNAPPLWVKLVRTEDHFFLVELVVFR
jgi:hypothetical protein